eukprot:scaffold23827_cov63-Phaeocystis_antarctica.AAC.3
MTPRVRATSDDMTNPRDRATSSATAPRQALALRTARRYFLRLRQSHAEAQASRLYGQRSTEEACGHAIFARTRACAASTQGRRRWACAQWTDFEGG